MNNNQALCIVRLTSTNNYFVRLSRRYLSSVTLSVGDVSIVQISSVHNTDKIYFCSVRGASAQDRSDDADLEVVEMSPNIGLLDKDPVIIQRPKEASIGLAVRVVVAPASEADWNIVSLNQGRVERSLLSQVRVVQAGQRLRVAVDQV